MKKFLFASAILGGAPFGATVPLSAQTMVADSLDGPVTANEIASFKNYINAAQPNTWTTVDNMANELAQYTTGQRLKAIGQMYELTGDVAILNRMIYFCDVTLSERNDIMAAPYGQHVMWTGTITHDWIQSQADPNATGNATAGDGAGHLAYCAHLILQNSSLINQIVPDHDVYDHGVTYGQRAATFLAEADDLYSSTAFPYYLDLARVPNRMYWPANIPNFSGTVPWNQQAMFSWGMMHAAAAHAILGDNPGLVTQYDTIVSAALDWFFNDSTSHLNYTDSAGRAAVQWGYSPGSYTSSIEDNSHGSLDTAWLYRCYYLGRYGLTAAEMTPLANTLCDVMLLGPYWMAGNVNGVTTGGGNSGPTTYVRDGWYFLTEFRPDKYYNVVATLVKPGVGTTNIGGFANTMWMKNRRYAAGYNVAFSPLPSAYTAAQTVALSSPTAGTTIRYTTDGSTPTPTTGTLYAGAFTVSQTTTVKAIAYTSTWTSAVSSADYIVWANTPSASPAAGTYIGTQSVTLSTTTPGATIRYTTDKSTPSATSGTLYTGPITVSASETIRAIAYTSMLSASNLRTAVYTIKSSSTPSAGAPAFSPGGGAYTGAQSVTISSSTSGASIYYTTDGTSATTSSTLYTGPVTISTGAVLDALVVATGYNNSSGSATYTIGATGTPTLSLSSGTYTGTQIATITCSTLGATIMFTLDGSTPTATNGYIYTGPFKIRQNATVNVMAYSDLHTNSPVVTATYNIATSAPTFSPAGGTYGSTQSVALSSVTSGASIRYTTDGSTPTSTTGLVYSGPVSISTNATLKAIAYESGLTDSPVASAIYAIQVAAPTFSPAGGTYTGTQSVTLSSATSDSSIRYTTDGSTPTPATGTLYSGPISISANTTLKAIAYATGLTDSSVSSASYTINVVGAPVKLALPAASVTASAYTSTYVPANTVDGSLSTRWAGNGDGVWIKYDLGAVETVSYVKLAWYAGTSRIYTFDVQLSTDGTTWTTVLSRQTSSGTTTALETYDFADASARYVRIVGHQNTTDTYTNITEAEVWVTPSKITVPSANVTASAYTSTFVPANTVDGSLSTRWAGNGDGVWIKYDLGATKTVSYAKLAFYVTVAQTYTFDVQASTDGTTWTTLLTRQTSSGATTVLQTFDIADTTARYVRVVGHMSSVDSYTNITEAEIWGY
jgi:hypothetical protein